MKLMVAVDGSEFTKRMLAYLAAHEEWSDGAHDITVVQVTPAVHPRAAAVMDKDKLKAYYEREAEAVLKPVRAFFKQRGLEVRFVSKVGDPAQRLMEVAARLKPDALVMGSHGRGAVGNLVLGSVVSKVLAGSRVPVLVVR